jgi:hypothetical protein
MLHVVDLAVFQGWVIRAQCHCMPQLHASGQVFLTEPLSTEKRKLTGTLPT